MEQAEEIKIKIQSKPDESLDLWVVCFTGTRDERYWWDKWKLTRRGFRHCYVVQYQPYTKRWVLIDWRCGICDVLAFEHDEMEYIFNQLAASEGTAVLFKKNKIDKEIYYRIPFIYCVSAALQVLGMPTRWTFTPKQLYKRIMRNGGEELLNHRSTEDGWIIEAKPFTNTEKDRRAAVRTECPGS